MAYLTNQKAVIDGPLRGYGVPTVGPVGSTPTTPFLSSEGKAQEASGVGPFPFSIAKAQALLTSHGWKVVPGGTSTCVDPAKCGPGIAAGKPLSFVFPYASGVAWITSMMTQLQSNAAWPGNGGADFAVVEVAARHFGRCTKSVRGSLGGDVDHAGVVVLAEQFALRSIENFDLFDLAKIPKATPLRGRTRHRCSRPPRIPNPDCRRPCRCRECAPW